MIVISSIVTYEPLEYNSADKRYIYPTHANVIGWLIAGASMAFIPGMAVHQLWKIKGTLREVRPKNRLNSWDFLFRRKLLVT